MIAPLGEHFAALKLRDFFGDSSDGHFGRGVSFEVDEREVLDPANAHHLAVGELVEEVAKLLLAGVRTQVVDEERVDL